MQFNKVQTHAIINNEEFEIIEDQAGELYYMQDNKAVYLPEDFQGWITTDASTGQMYKQVTEDEVYIFRENRIVNPVTFETEVFQKTMDINKYTWAEKITACKTFGYTAEQVDKWITEGEETPLILECLFELSN